MYSSVVNMIITNPANAAGFVVFINTIKVKHGDHLLKIDD